ncbi:hypothetical protein [Allocoleopsis sp.]|uniref:hypothetical protein n=1 Tax=Allocoleopsis sp. TaxID=3088169 RepID=UPI002FCF81BE
MRESTAEYSTRLDEIIQIGKLKAEYKNLLLEIADLGEKACRSRLIVGLGWGEDANGIILDEYEILDTQGELLYLTMEETRSYLYNLIEQNDSNKGLNDIMPNNLSS